VGKRKGLKEEKKGTQNAVFVRHNCLGASRPLPRCRPGRKRHKKEEQEGASKRNRRAGFGVGRGEWSEEPVLLVRQKPSAVVKNL